MHPKNADLVYVAVLGNVFGPDDERGIFRSNDGGENWEKVLYFNESVGVVDLSMNPVNPRILYASAWNGERKPWTLISGSEDVWSLQDRPTEATPGKSSAVDFPKVWSGAIGVAVSPANPNRVWALVEQKRVVFIRSDDDGKTWQKISDQSGIRERSWYYMHVTADPKDANTVWISNVFMYKSVDGGKTFDFVGTAHGDNHDLWINPDNTDIMINADDGGAAVTLNGGRTWSTQRNQPTAEFYRVTVDNQFPYRLYGPQQDNTTVSVPSRRRREPSAPPKMSSRWVVARAGISPSIREIPTSSTQAVTAEASLGPIVGPASRERSSPTLNSNLPSYGVSSTTVINGTRRSASRHTISAVLYHTSQVRPPLDQRRPELAGDQSRSDNQQSRAPGLRGRPHLATAPVSKSTGPSSRSRNPPTKKACSGRAVTTDA